MIGRNTTRGYSKVIYCFGFVTPQSYMVVGTIFFLLQVYRHIFTSPLSAIGKVRKGTKPSKAQIYGMKCASSHTITYACIEVRFVYIFTPPDALQMRFLLSNLSSWCTVDGHFDLHAFYDNIVALFEMNLHSPWVVETLNWWNTYIFPQTSFIDLIFLSVKFCGRKLKVTRRARHAKTLQSLKISVTMTFWQNIMLRYIYILSFRLPSFPPEQMQDAMCGRTSQVISLDSSNFV